MGHPTMTAGGRNDRGGRVREMSKDRMKGRAHVDLRDHIRADELAPIGPQSHGGGAREILVAGEDFGCGPPRERAVGALRAAGVAAVVARSFALAFLRDALHDGLVAVECPDAVTRVAGGDVLEVDLRDSVVRNLSRGEVYPFAPLAPFALELLEAGGLLPYVLRQTTGGSSA